MASGPQGESNAPDSQQNQPTHGHSERLAFHQLAAADVAFFKQQQWRVTNYSLVLYGSFLAVPKLLPEDISRNEFLVLAVMALVVMLASLYVLADLETSLRIGRDRLGRMRRTFDDLVLADWAPDGNPQTARQKAKDKPTLIWMFRAVIVIGFVVVEWLLFRQACAI